ncbi:MAG: pantothenate kinase [Firmicutes bacterium HGW-Firmicutes-7]|nr:MAG: pantothenate kinase [Firmicutes bacterium HGW-Firmicutes-7]
MLLVVDIGNTNITLGVYEKDNLLGSFRMTTKTPRTSDEYGLFIISWLKNRGIETEMIKDTIISSVVPTIMYSFNNGIKKYMKKEPIIVGPGIKTGISVNTEAPKDVGADRIVDLAGAFYTYGGPTLVIDFGTATTYDVVTDKATFEVGVTSPGIKISANALWQKAAKLPEVEIKKPDSILARNTITSMQAGLVYGYIGQVEYIVKKIKEELAMEMKVIATGGLARIIVDETDAIDIYDPDLTFKGLKIIYEKNLKK